MNIDTIRSKTEAVFLNQGIVKAAVFGSYATGEAKNNSDIDLIIDFDDRKSLFDLAGIKIELEEALKKKVDLLTYRSLYPPLKKSILKEQIVIYEKGS